MEYARLGNTGMKVSRICLGCMGFGDVERSFHKWVLNEEDSRPVIRKALEAGDQFLRYRQRLFPWDERGVPRTRIKGFRQTGRGGHRHQSAWQNA